MSMSKSLQLFPNEVLVNTVELAFEKFCAGTFGDRCFDTDFVPPLSVQEKLLRDLIVIELSHLEGWRHGKGFKEKDVIYKSDKNRAALVIVSADPVGFRQNRKVYRIERDVNPQGHYIAVNFTPSLMLNDAVTPAYLAQIRTGYLKIQRTSTQAQQFVISIKFNDLRLLKLAKGPYLHNAPLTILRGVGRAAVRELEKRNIFALGQLLDDNARNVVEKYLKPQAAVDLDKYLIYLEKTPAPVAPSTPRAPRMPPSPRTPPVPQVSPAPEARVAGRGPKSLSPIKIELKKPSRLGPMKVVSNPEMDEYVDETKVQRKGDLMYANEEEANLDIPLPPPPKGAKEELNLEMSELVFTDDKYADDPNYQHILIMCEWCGGVIKMPVPKDVVLSSDLPVVPVTYVHGAEGNKHALLAHLDHDFQVRRRRFSHLVES